MNRQKVLVVTNDIIVERITSMIEGMSTNDFVESICEKVGVDLENEDEVEEVRNLIGSKVIPLYNKMSEYFLEVDFFEKLTEGE
jgi:hypothetical protein